MIRVGVPGVGVGNRPVTGDRALKDLGLERFWAEWDANGKPKG